MTDGREERASHDDPGGGSQPESKPPPASQWVVAGISGLAVLALLGFVVYEAVTGTALPPVVTVRAEQVLELPNGYLVEVKVTNSGGSTAASLEIEGTLKRDTVTFETSTATLSFVPAQSARDAGLYFTRDPRRYRLELRALGYDQP